jgi:hypothetical protein
MPLLGRSAEKGVIYDLFWIAGAIFQLSGDHLLAQAPLSRIEIPACGGGQGAATAMARPFAGMINMHGLITSQ